jgi:alcohol dehydrogenase, propanol-preferring
LRGWGEPLRVGDAPEPVAGVGEVLVELSATGVCHADVNEIRGDWPEMKHAMETSNVTIVGHEGIGKVRETGSEAGHLKAGDRVGVPWLNYWCGRCDLCLSGSPYMCSSAKVTSLTKNGTYAQFVTVSERSAPPVPPEISDEEAAPLLCAGITSYAAVKKLSTRLGIPAGKRVAVIGAAGGLGHYVVQIARAFGYSVTGVDIGKEKLEFVSRLGADEAIDAKDAEQSLKGRGGVSAAVVLTPRVAGYQLATRVLGKQGAIIAVGTPDLKEGFLNVPMIDLIENGTQIMPSVGGAFYEFQELFGLYTQGKVKTHISKKGNLEDANEILSELSRSRYLGRAVLSTR